LFTVHHTAAGQFQITYKMQVSPDFFMSFVYQHFSINLLETWQSVALKFCLQRSLLTMILDSIPCYVMSEKTNV